MKKVRFIWISVFLVMVFAATCCTYVYADFEMTLTLEKVGEIQEEKLDYESIKSYPAGLITKDAEGIYYVLDEMGNNNLGRSYGKAEYFTDELFMVYDAETWPNSCGLVKADGTVVLPCEAAIINSIEGTDRYLKISVATEATDKENAFLYTYTGWVAWPDEQSEYYDGYAHYYDLKEGKYFEDWDEADLSELQGYRCDEVEKDRYAILAQDGTVLTELDFWPSEIYGEGEVFSRRQDDGYIVVDRNGEPITEIEFKSSPSETNGYLSAVNVEDEEGNTVIDFDGKIYADGADKIWNVIGMPCDLTYLYNRDENSLLLYPDGTVAELGKNDSGGELPFYRKHNDGEPDSIFVLNKGEYLDIEENLVNSYIDSYLMILAIYDGETEYSLYNTIDGSLLLEKAGTKFYGSDYWIYALKDGVWGVYKVALSY